MPALYLGDARAEQDYPRQKDAFYESPDYRTLIESDVKSIVVGRRGVGKSALFLRLTDYYDDENKVEVIKFAPEEHEVLAFRPIAAIFDSKFNLVRAATRLAFRYALMLELAQVLSTRYKFSQSEGSDTVVAHIRGWRSPGGLLAKLRRIIEQSVKETTDPESKIGALAEALKLTELESALASVMEDMKRNVVFLVDRLDEGYEPDGVGVAVVDGFLQAAIDLKDKLPYARCIVFLRDNIYRAVEHHDQDFSRNLEQAVLRLHWDERGLLNFAANRIRHAGGAKAEKSIRVWDSVTRGALQGESGFHYCLRLTLYRPRDLLLLLNDAFRQAAVTTRHAIDQDDVNSSAEAISQLRAKDLEKEYEAHIPGLGALMRAFSNRNPKFTYDHALSAVSDVLDSVQEDPKVVQQFELFNGPVEALRSLYSVGFLGLRDEGSSNFVFCHDGRRPDRDFVGEMELMVHPCYWMAFNLKPRDGDEPATSEIYDEYDVTVTSETPEQRNRSIGRLEAELRDIEKGVAGAAEFEKWCLKVVKVLFPAGLRNIELNSNKDALQRRDVVGTNHGSTDFWRRILHDYGTRQVVFEVKNFESMERQEFRQILSYLSKDYGNIGFIITRGGDVNLRKERELAWVRELRNEHGKTVVILPDTFLVRLIQKIRNPAKHDAAEEALGKLLDTYVRTYFGEGAPRKKRQKY